MNKFKKFFYSQKAAPYVFVLPFIVSFAFFWIYPLFSTITMSFQDIKPTGAEWVGLKNFSKLLKDTVFHTAILNSFEYMKCTLSKIRFSTDSFSDVICGTDGLQTG